MQDTKIIYIKIKKKTPIGAQSRFLIQQMEVAKSIMREQR